MNFRIIGCPGPGRNDNYQPLEVSGTNDLKDTKDDNDNNSKDNYGYGVSGSRRCGP